MAGKIGSKDFGVLLVDGYDFLAAKLQGFTHKVVASQEKSNGLGDSVETMTPTGLETLSIAQTGGFFDDSANGIHVLLSTSANLAVSRFVCAAFAGNIIGKPFLGISGAYGMEYEAAATVGNLTKANVTYNVSGSLDRGVIVMNQGPQMANWTGTAVDYTTDTSQQNIPIVSNTLANPTVVTTSVPHGLTTGQVILIAGNVTSSPAINGQQAVTVISALTFSVPVNCTTAGTGGSFVRASTVNGGVAYQMVSAFSGFSGVIGKIRHSADNSTFADLAVFTNVTGAPGTDPNVSQRVVVAAGTTVNRYLESTGAVTGSGSITPFHGFSRA